MVNRVFSIATSGLAAQRTRLQASASNIANINTADYQPLRVKINSGNTGVSTDVVPVEGRSLIRDIVTMSTAVRAYEANISVLRSADQMAQNTIDILS